MKLMYDFHIHSCLSPCGDMDMTPGNIVNMAKLMGYDAIALTDHNTSGNCESAMYFGKQAGLTVIPGMELCTQEEVHIVCLFPTLENAMDFSDYVYSTLPPVKNKADIFGEQAFCDKADEISGYEEKLLITASSIGTGKVKKTVEQYGGICYPAHIDRPSFSIISNLGIIDESFGFSFAEIFDREKTAELKEKFPVLKKMKIISDSDAHYLDKLRPENSFIEVSENTAKGILDFFKE